MAVEGFRFFPFCPTASEPPLSGRFLPSEMLDRFSRFTGGIPPPSSLPLEGKVVERSEIG